jgi:hypothetical protein
LAETPLALEITVAAHSFLAAQLVVALAYADPFR